MTRTDAERIRDALNHLDTLRSHLECYTIRDQLITDAVSLRLSAAIDAVSNVNDGLRYSLFGSEWNLMWAMRNRIAHGYSYIDSELLWNSILQDLPEFEEKLRNWISTTTSGD